MGKLVTFLITLLGLVVVASLVKYRELPTTSERFSFEAASEAHANKLKELADLAAKREEHLHPKVVEEEVVDQGPVVVLDTPQLERGSDLYQKCVVCHGKLGEGKKAQNAPRIGGQLDWYIEQQLVNMKTGARVNAVMNPYLKPLEGQDFKDLAAYISKLPWDKK